MSESLENAENLENENVPLLENEIVPALENTNQQTGKTNTAANEDLENNGTVLKNNCKLTKILLTILIIALSVLSFVILITGLSLFSMKQTFLTNQNSLKNLTVTDTSMMVLELDGFSIPGYLSPSITIFGWKYVLQPFIKMLKPEVYLPNCANEPTILLNMDFDIDFAYTNNYLVPRIQSSVENPNFIPWDFSHNICIATEDYVLTPLDLLIEYIGRNKAESETERENVLKDVFWTEDMNLGLSMLGLNWLKKDKIEYPVKKELISNSTFVQNLEVLNKVDFNNTKFDIFEYKVSGDFFIEINLNFLKNIDIINFKMLKGDFFISLDGSDKKMMLVKIPDWQKCSVRSIKTENSEGLDMVIELKLKDADVEILNDGEFTKFGKRWFLDKKVDVLVDSKIDLIISDDQWLGSMVLRHLKSTDSTTLRN
ncbi:hypothetical protein FOG48_00717 [Hanseniaspora uvarum]|nr:hypothetical protein FOG48_00717 [Hanseniaspora uvarum]